MAEDNLARQAGNSSGAAMPPTTGRKHMIPVWFFVGILLLVYGILIFITGLREWPHPPATVLSNLHPTFWWSFILIILGAVFTFLNFPGRKR